MIGIIGAMDVEIEELKKRLSNISTYEIGPKVFFKGTYENQVVVVALAGIGKTNASITTTLLLENFKISKLINIGVAGGLKPIKHKDVVISTEVLYHDFDVTSFSDYKIGQVPGSNPTFTADQELLELTNQVLQNQKISHVKGIIASGDQFVTDQSHLIKALKDYPLIKAVDMEAASIAHVATIYNIPFIIYRSISDILNDEGQSTDFTKFVEEASIEATNVLTALLHQLSWNKLV